MSRYAVTGGGIDFTWLLTLLCGGQAGNPPLRGTVDILSKERGIMLCSQLTLSSIGWLIYLRS